MAQDSYRSGRYRGGRPGGTFTPNPLMGPQQLFEQIVLKGKTPTSSSSGVGVSGGGGSGGPSTSLSEGGRSDGGGDWGGGESSGPSAAELAAQEAERKAKQAGKDQTKKENDNTNKLVDALIAGMAGFASARDTQLKNATKNFDTALSSILASYNTSIANSDEFANRNDADFADKSSSNVLNLVRETNDLAAQALSMGAGETDALRAMQQAARNFDANRSEVSTSYADTLRGINSERTAAASSAESARTNAWQSREEANAGANNDYYKNMLDQWTNIQRTEAQNTNVESDYSTGFNARYADKSVDEIKKLTGKAYESQKPGEGWAANWEGKQGSRESASRDANRAAGLRAGPARKAQGADLRKWA